jgi:PAS domain S-box-containing protein
LQLWRWEGQFILPSGQVKWIQGTSVPEQQANGDILWDGLLMDITTGKQTEEALRQAREELELRVEERTAELRQANEQLQFTQFSRDHAPEAIFWMDAEGRFFYVNKVACQLLGYSREELLSMSVPDVASNFPWPSWFQHWRELQSTGSLTLESTIRAKDGRIFPSELSVNYLEFNGQQYNCAFVRNISQRKQAEGYLRESEQRFRRLVEQAADAIIVHDLEGKILDVNQQACTSLGYTREELLALSIPAIEENYIPGAVWEYVRHGIPATVNGRQRRKDGTFFPVEMRLGLLEFNGQQLILALVRDITERKQIEEERDRTQRFLNSLLDNLPVAVFAKDAQELRFIFWNKTSTQLMGYSCEQALGKSTHEVFPAEVADLGVAKDREVLASGQPLDIPEILLETPHQGQRILHTIKVPIPDEAGTPQYLLGIIEDITERKQTEAALRQSQERLQTVMTSAPLILFSLDRQGIFTLSEGKGLEAIGLKPGQLVGSSIYDFYQDKPEFIEHFNRAIAGESLENIIVNVAEIVFDNRYSIIRDDKGEIVSVTGIALDITERHRAKEALQQSEQKFRSIVENANDIIYQLTPDGVFSYVSPNWVDILGHNISEVEGNVFVQFVHPDDVPICLGTLHRAIETGQKQSGVEYRVRHKNGAWRWHTSSLAVLRDASGTVLSVIGIARDISDRKHAEDALRESEERFRNLVESTNDLIWETNEHGIYTYMSPQIKDTLGYEVEEVLGKTPFDFMLPEEASCVFEMMSNRVALRFPLTNLENTNLHKNGNLVVLETSGVPFFDKAGNFKGYRGIDRDITKRKQTEEAIQQSKAQLQKQANQLKQALRQLKATQTQLIQTEKMSSLGQLVAGVAHEINNPVNFIYGNVKHARNYMTDLLGLIYLYQNKYPEAPLEIAEEIQKIDLDFVTEDFPKLLDSMEMGTQRIRGIVESLRNFSRFDEATVKQVNIHQGIDSTLMLLQSRLTQHLLPAAIQVVKEYGNLPLVECYPGHLNQVFMNLLTNAIDALNAANSRRSPLEAETNPSIIRIYTETCQESSSNPQIVIRIADNGVGMTEEVRLRAFDPFFTTKPVGEGTGLGLAISYQIIVELHKGQLDCHSCLGEGTEFVIKIPIRQ